MFRTLMAAMLLISSVGLASAKDAYVKLYGGISDPSYSDSYAATGGIAAGNVSADGSSEFYGGAVGYYFTESFSVELAVEQLEVDFTGAGGIVGSGTLETTAGFINAYYHFNDNFYIGGGIGGGEPDIDNFRVTQANANPRALNANERNVLDNLVTDINIPYQGIIGYKFGLTDNIYWDSNLRHLVISDLKLTTVSTGLRFEF